MVVADMKRTRVMHTGSNRTTEEGARGLHPKHLLVWSVRYQELNIAKSTISELFTSREVYFHK